MIRRPPRVTRTDTLFPYTTRFRSIVGAVLAVPTNFRPARKRRAFCSCRSCQPIEKVPARWLLTPRRVLLVFQPLDLALHHFADESRPALPPDQLVDTLAEPFRQTNIGRFHIERRPSDARVVTKQGARSIGSRISGTGY